jgi:hypothetical protein
LDASRHSIGRFANNPSLSYIHNGDNLMLSRISNCIHLQAHWPTMRITITIQSGRKEHTSDMGSPNVTPIIKALTVSAAPNRGAPEHKNHIILQKL